MKSALLPQLLYLIGVLCFLCGTLISIKQTIDGESANINCGADRL